MFNARLLGTAVALVAAAALAATDPSTICRDIRGTIRTVATTQDCPSQLGVCYVGQLRTNSPLRGDTFFVLETMGVDAAGNLTYTGTLFVTLPRGTVVEFQSSGVLDPNTLQFTETDILVPSSGLPSGTSLTITGTADPGLAGFTGEVTGELCGVPTLMKE